LVRRFIYNILTLTVSQWVQGRIPGRGYGDEEFLLNLIKKFTFTGIKRRFCDFVINEYTVNIE